MSGPRALRRERRYSATLPLELRMRFVLPLAGLTLLSLANPARAQDAMQLSELRPGVRIRLEAPGSVAGLMTATVTSRSRDTITIADENVAPLAVPLSHVTRVDISRGKSHSAGAVLGMKWGLAIGVPVGILAAASPDCEGCVKTSAAEWIALSVLDGVALGAGIGALVGRENWVRFQ